MFRTLLLLYTYTFAHVSNVWTYACGRIIPLRGGNKTTPIWMRQIAFVYTIVLFGCLPLLPIVPSSGYWNWTFVHFRALIWIAAACKMEKSPIINVLLTLEGVINLSFWTYIFVFRNNSLIKLYVSHKADRVDYTNASAVRFADINILSYYSCFFFTRSLKTLCGKRV